MRLCLLLAAIWLVLPVSSVAAADDYSSVVVSTEATDLDAAAAGRIVKAAAEAARGTALALKGSPEETDAALKKAGQNPRSCAGALPCMARLGKAVEARYVVAVGLARLGATTAVTIDLVDATSITSLGHFERGVKGEVDWTKVMAEALAAALPAHLAKPLGTLVVAAKVEGAEVSVDGAKLGRTPIAPIRLPPGDHSLVVTKEGFAELHDKVAISSGASTRYDAELKSLKAVAVAPAKPAVVPTKPDKGTEPAVHADAEGPNRVPAYAVGGGAVAALGAGVAFGLARRSQEKEYFTACAAWYGVSCEGLKTLPTTKAESEDLAKLRSGSNTKGLLANVFLGVGVAAAATAVTLFVIAPSASPVAAEGEAPAAQSLWLAPAPDGVALGGTF